MPHQIVAQLRDIDKVASYLKDNLEENIIIFLDGEVGAGKTTLTQSIAKQFGISDSVTSPTFSLQQCYDDKIFHYDLYRLDGNDFFNIGLHEEMDKIGWHIIEWGNSKLKEFLELAGYNTLTVTILPAEDKRCYIIGDKCIH